MKRVVITGMGALSPIGMDVPSLWESICQGRHGFTKIEGFSAAEMGITYSAQIHGFDPAAYGIPKKEARRMDAYTQYAVVAARQAVENSGYLLGEEDPYRVGVVIGSGVGGFNTIRTEHEKFLEKGPGRVSVFFVPMMIANMAAGTVAIEHGFKGVNFATVTACSSGAHAIGEAFRAIKHGYIDCAVAGGSEACIDQLSMAGFHNMGALARGEDPDRLSIPFDGERNGFVMAEGAGMLFLEEYEHAKRRDAHIFGEIAGYGATGDAYHITSPAPSGEGAVKAMQLAVEESGLRAEDVGYINAHGTATVLNDQCETRAIKLAFGEQAKKLAVSSTKSMTGHMLGAAGAVEAILCLKALEEGIIPPTINYRTADPECDLDYVTEGARKAPSLRCAISNAFGFGGHNATLCFKKYEGEA
ncbi:MAG: beta-ketoacyl-ACP synthase II [Provencibacterium sp.]|jgi:3-oxoacyl-[acyl-carrier-protein] synthase II|nr:beta-ketoacyl-ACP synthase II [Provencibacterium sp.]